jgi:hypothetical protein
MVRGMGCSARSKVSVKAFIQAVLFLVFAVMTTAVLQAQTADPAKPETAEESTDNTGSRTWTSRNGKTIEAEFVKLQSSILHLKRANGTTTRIPLRNLSDEDVAIAKQLASAKTEDTAESASSTGKKKLTARGSKASGLLSDEEIEGLLTEWTDDKGNKGYEFEATMRQVTTLSAKDKKKYAKSGEVPFIMYAYLYEFKISKGKKSYKRDSGSCKIYILDSENTVVVKKSVSLDKLCAT